MKSTGLLIVFKMLLALSVCTATTTLNLEQREFQLVQGAILQYQRDTNEFPTSWDDLWSNKASRPSVESLDQGELFGRRTDMMESFRFIAPGTTIILPRDGSTVIGMMTRPMRPPPETRRRFLIVKLKDGARGLKQIPEETLHKMFSEIGLSLADYTGPNGNWAPETRLRPLSEIPPPPKRTLSDPSMDYSTIPSLPDEIRSDTSNNSTNATANKAAFFPWWIIASFSILLVIALVAWLRFRKSKSTH